MSNLESRRYEQLRAAFLNYAEHHHSCQRWTHKHKLSPTADNRISCDVAPCNCGVDTLLHRYNPDVAYTVPCPDSKVRELHPDADTPVSSIFGLPVVESSDVPEGHIQVGHTLVEAFDADTGKPVE